MIIKIMLIVAKIVHWVFVTYTFFLFAHIVGSWFPTFSRHRLMRLVRFYTEPYLNLFRRLIPPIGGALDLSPILGFFALNLLERFVLGLLAHL